MRFLIASVCVGASVLGFSTEMMPVFEQLEIPVTSPACLQMNKGYISLFQGDFAGAAEEFERVGLAGPVEEFMICLGKLVAYDNLGMVKECEAAVGRIIFIVQDDEEDDDEDSEEDDSDIPEEAKVFFRTLVSLAKTPSVTKFLQDVLEELCN